MAPVDLEGETLGERHQHFNKLVRDSVAQILPSEKLDPDGMDIDNLIKIDVANSRKDLEFVLDVLRGEDMLYVSRALKNGLWLLEPQYAHVFNPESLHTELIPTLRPRAASKMLLFIRLHLKDEARVDLFYRYYEKKNLNHAFKWLPRCSISLAEEVVLKYQHQIDNHIIKRLCERSFNFLTLYTKDNINNYNLDNVLKSTMFFLNTDMERYMDLIDSTRDVFRYSPKFGPKATGLVMKKFPEKILTNFEKYANIVDIPTVAKHIKSEDVKGFLIKQMANERMKSKFNFDTLKLFAKRMPKEEIFEFLKKVFIDKEVLKPEDEPREDCGDKIESVQYCAMSMPCRGAIMKRKYAGFKVPKSSANIYRWYRFAPFETAFPELKKLIRSESDPSERNEILAVLLVCAARKPQHVHELLKFYQQNHINEPFRFKVHFVNQLLSKTDAHKFDTKTWEILNNIFRSMEVYIESNNDAESCVRTIIVHKLLNDEPVPEIIEKKFSYSTMKTLWKRLTPEQCDKVFGYLYQYLEKQLKEKDLSTNKGFNEAVDLIAELRKLLVDWRKDTSAYPIIQTKATECVKVLSEQKWKYEFIRLFKTDGWWRRLLFETSVALHPTEETLLNALKHRPAMLEQHEDVMQTLRRDDNTTLWRLLAKLRVYWPHSMAAHWTAEYRARLTTPGGQRAIARGLCALLPHKDLVPLLREYAPQNQKIEWASENEEIELSLRKSLAQNMHHARPQPPLDVALLYARGDYLQFALPALTSIAYGLTLQASKQAVPVLIDTPVSLRKHGLRLAFAKLPTHELTPIFSSVWSSSKNSTIRAVLFNQTFLLMSREKRPEVIEELWQMLSLFIDNLSTEENKEIYATLGKIDDVPESVKAHFCAKSLTFLKTLPAKANCEDIVNDLIYGTREIMKNLDYDFVIQEVMPHVEKNLSTNTWSSHINIITAFMLSAPDEKSQDVRYKTVLLPLLNSLLADWNKQYESKHRNSEIIRSLLECFCRDVTNYVLEKGMIIPVKMYEEIEKKLKDNLKIENKYYFTHFWKLIVGFVKILDKHSVPIVAAIKEEILEEKSNKRAKRTEEPIKSDKLLMELIVPEFTEFCLAYLTDDFDEYFPSVYLLFGDALKSVFDELNLSQIVLQDMKKNLLREDFIPSYLMVIEMLPYYSEYYKDCHKLIKSHPAAEVTMHYFRKYKDIDDIKCC